MNMTSAFSSCRFVFYLLIASLILNYITDIVEEKIHAIYARYIKEKMLKKTDIDDGHHLLYKHQTISPQKEGTLNVYFHLENLKVGNKITIYFSLKNSSTSPHILPREESDSIPFSLSRLSQILDFFSLPKNTLQAKAMENTLSECESEPVKGETKFCATSLESMIDSTRRVFGLEAEFTVLSTNFVSNHSVAIQNYTVLEEVKEVLTPKMMACHTMPYPYGVYYCHGQQGDRKLFQIKLVGENGERVDALGVCHTNTSQWDPAHVSFQVLGTRPGLGPVCHFFPTDNLIWVVSSSKM